LHLKVVAARHLLHKTITSEIKHQNASTVAAEHIFNITFDLATIAGQYTYTTSVLPIVQQQQAHT
jgi:hypothetical protein